MNMHHHVYLGFWVVGVVLCVFTSIASCVMGIVFDMLHRHEPCN